MRRLLRIAVPVAVIAAILWLGYWSAVLWAVEDRLEAQLARAADRGTRIGIAETSWGGLPERAALRLDGITAEYPDGGRIAVPEASVSLALLSPLWVDAAAAPPVTFSHPGGGGPAVAGQLDAAALGGRVRLDPDRPRITARAEWPKLDVTLGEAATSLSASADSAEATVTLGADDATLEAMVARAVVPVPPDLPLGPTIEAFDLVAHNHGPVPRGPTAAAALAGWRDAGGALEIERLLLDWPPLRLEASGTIRLDAGLRPVGTLDTSVSGFEPILDALAQQGVLPRDQMTMMKLLLGRMAAPGPDGRPTLRLPLAARDGALFLGPVRLRGLPALATTGTS